MPNGDGSGPKGLGPKTGRQRGNCEGAKPFTQGFGRRVGCRRGCGLGMRRGLRQEANTED